MSETSGLGVLYTENAGLTWMTPVASLWSYEMRSRERDRRSITLTPDGSHEYWLELTDPLLNTILPGTHVSLIVNAGDLWAAGRPLGTFEHLPRVCAMGPFTESRILRVGGSVHAVGAVVAPTLTPAVFGVPASELVDRIVPLHDLWPREDVETLLVSVGLDIRRCLSALREQLLARIGRRSPTTVGQAARLVNLRGGRVSVDHMAKSYGLSRQQFARRFSADTGLPPKLFARITRFQALVHTLLSTDVSRWASVASAVGFYDQAHMINEFRAFAGSPPTAFFQQRHGNIIPARIQLRGRPSEWHAGAERAIADLVRAPRVPANAALEGSPAAQVP